MDRAQTFDTCDAFVDRALTHKLAELFPQFNGDGLALLCGAVKEQMHLGMSPGMGGYTTVAQRFGLLQPFHHAQLAAIASNIIATIIHYGPDVAQPESLDWIEWSY